MVPDTFASFAERCVEQPLPADPDKIISAIARGRIRMVIALS